MGLLYLYLYARPECNFSKNHDCCYDDDDDDDDDDGDDDDDDDHVTSRILVLLSFACLRVHLLSTNIASNVSDRKRYKARSETGCSVIISAGN